MKWDAIIDLRAKGSLIADGSLDGAILGGGNEVCIRSRYCNSRQVKCWSAAFYVSSDFKTLVAARLVWSRRGREARGDRIAMIRSKPERPHIRSLSRARDRRSEPGLEKFFCLMTLVM